MKKVGKKLSYMTKVLLVLGLIISNLSSLSVVFADVGEEGTDKNTQVTTLDGENEASLNTDGTLDDSLEVENEANSSKGIVGLDASISDDNKITVIYGSEVNDTDELQIRVTEKYKYNNCETTESVACEEVINTTQSVNDENRALLLGEGMSFDYTPSLLKNAKFDGKYTLVVTLVNVTEDNNVLEEKIIDEEENRLPSGIVFKVYDDTDTLIKETSGKYIFDTSVDTIKVVGKMQAGGISPNDVFVYGEEESSTEYTASEFLELSFEHTIKLSGYLYGEFKLPVSVVYVQNDEETEFIKNLNISHGTYEDNTKLLNSFADSSKFLFEGTTKSGKLYVYLSDTEITLNDVDVPFYDAYFESENVWYTFSNEELNSDTVVTVTDGITTITYQVVVVGDVNDDGILDKDDIVALADQLVGNLELDLDKANIDNNDDEANVHDILKLTQIVKTGAWGIDLIDKEIQLDAGLELDADITEIVSGDEFDVNYVIKSADADVKGFAGLVNFDDEMLELLSITVTDNYIGSDKDGKFVYVDIEDATDQANEEKEEIVKLLTLRFKALNSGDTTITIDNAEFFDQNIYFTIVEIDEETGESTPTTQVISLDVTVSQSSDNSLSSLKLGDNEIQLEDGVYDYELTVGNDVTKLDVSAIVTNIAASITSIVSPEELAEGENTITVTVVSENGEESTYTVLVTRESVPEKTVDTNNTNQNNYQNNTYNNETNNIKPQEPSKNDDKKDNEPVVEPVKEKSNLSKIIIIVLIVLVIGGLIYLIFKDDDDEAKTTNKEINKFKKDDFDNSNEKVLDNNKKKNQNKNNKKER